VKVPMFVLNATPVIYLAKTDRIQLLKELEICCVLPNAVYEEVVKKGKEQGEADALKVDNCVENDVLIMKEAPKTPLSKKLDKTDWLDKGEHAVLVIAEESDAKAILDDKYGRQIAEAEDINYGGTIHILIQLVKEDVLKPSDMKETVDDMIKLGWYCSTELYAEIIKKIDEL